jgi:hypothetical protein
VGDKVFVKLQPYVQSSLACRAHQKLAFKYFGSYTIQEKIGSVAYKLNLPTDSAIHPVFHINHLKKLVSTSAVSSVLPNGHVEYQVPKKVLVIRVKKSGAAEVTQVLIKWSHMSQDLATWEDKVSLMQQFPSVHAWGQAGHQNQRGVSIVTLPGRRAASTRTSKPNPKVTGLEWAGPCEDTIAGHQETDCTT